MPSRDVELVIAHVGFTGSDGDRERSLTMDVWLNRHDPEFADKLRVARTETKIVEHRYDLNFDPPRDFLADPCRADIVLVHFVFGFPASGRKTGTSACSPLHEVGCWNRCLASTGARYIFMFGGHLPAQPDGYESINAVWPYKLTVWTQIETPFRIPIMHDDLAEARLKRLEDFMENEVLDLSYVAEIATAQLEMIARMPKLRCLLLSGVRATDDEIATMLRSGCHRLRSLFLDQTLVGGASLRALSSCADMTVLSLNDTWVGDAGLAHLSNLPHLETLSLVNTNVGAADVEPLAALRNLRVLALTGSGITRREVDMLAHALPHCAIDIAAEAAH